jgi:hypothetical protein
MWSVLAPGALGQLCGMTGSGLLGWSDARSVLRPGPGIVLDPPDFADPNSLGRVKVRFHWESSGVADQENTWSRLQTFGGGVSYGSFFLPGVRDEVLVTFIGGDPDRPVLTGQLYNNPDDPNRHGPSRSIKAGNATGPNRDGGSIFFEPGKGMGTGKDGVIWVNATTVFSDDGATPKTQFKTIAPGFQVETFGDFGIRPSGAFKLDFAGSGVGAHLSSGALPGQSVFYRHDSTEPEHTGTSVTIQAGDGAGPDKDGGGIIFQPGAATGSGTPGAVQINGPLVLSSLGGALPHLEVEQILDGSDYTFEVTVRDPAASAGSSISIQAGNATGADKNGGNVEIKAGKGTGTGKNGTVQVKGTLEITDDEGLLLVQLGPKSSIEPMAGLRIEGYIDAENATSVTLPRTGITGGGAGSGLDADLLDGLDSSAFAQPSLPQTWTAPQNWSGGANFGDVQVSGSGSTLNFQSGPSVLSLDFTPGAVFFRGQPIDFAGTEPQFLAAHFNQPQGMPPFSVFSSTVVPNLNADKLDGHDWGSHPLLKNLNGWFDGRLDWVSDKPAVRIKAALETQSGEPASGVADVTVRIYPTAMGGTAVYDERFSGVTVVDGHADLLLGAGLGTASGDLAPVFSTLITPGGGRIGQLYLGLQLNSEPELTRQRVSAVPLAIAALEAASLGGQPASAYATQSDLAAEAALRQAIVEEFTQFEREAENEFAFLAQVHPQLRKDIDNEVATRTGEVTALRDSFEDEAVARLAADTTLQNNINAEAQARQNADTTLQQNLDDEAAARMAADAALAGSEWLTPSSAMGAFPGIRLKEFLPNYQGQAGAVVDLTILLYDTAEGGSQLYSEMFNATPVVHGNLDVTLGAGLGTASGDLKDVLRTRFLAELPIYVGVEAAGDPPLPRKRLGAVGYAFVASHAAQAQDTQRLGGKPVDTTGCAPGQV